MSYSNLFAAVESGEEAVPSSVIDDYIDAPEDPDVSDGVNDILQAADELEDVQETLEAMKEDMSPVADVMRSHLRRQYAHIVSRTGADSKTIRAGLESDSTVASLEGAISDTAKKFWEAILKAIDWIKEMANKFWVWLTDSSTRVKANAQKLKSRVTGRRSEGQALSQKTLADMAWPEKSGGRLVADADSISKTRSWLSTLDRRIKEDYEASDKTMVGLVSKVPEMERRVKDLERSSVKFSNRREKEFSVEERVMGDLTDIVDTLLRASYLTDPNITRIWRTDYVAGMRHNKRIRAVKQGSDMPGGYVLVMYADYTTVQPGLNLRVSSNQAETVSTINLKLEKEASKDEPKIDVEGIDGAMDHAFLDKMLDDVIVSCDVIHKTKRDWKSRERHIDTVKDYVQQFKNYVLEGDKKNREERGKSSFPSNTVRARMSTHFTRKHVGVILNVFLKTGYQSSRLYMKRAIAANKSLLHLANAYTAGTRKDGDTIPADNNRLGYVK